MSNKEGQEKESIIGELILQQDSGDGASGGLVVEPEGDLSESDSFARQLEETLRETEAEVKEAGRIRSLEDQITSWGAARELVNSFKPVPWFIWRLSNYVLGRAGKISPITEGLVFGMRRLIFAAASDKVLGSGEKVNNVRRALQLLPPDVISAVSVIHAVCRRLHTRQFERIWRPIIDDALLRCQIGFYIGQVKAEFGPGRGMLAGFAGRCGLAILIASGELEQARMALEMLAGGADISEVGVRIYECDPLQVSALTLSAAGCGRDAAFGTVAYASDDPLAVVQNEPQKCWLAAFTIAENVRMFTLDKVDVSLLEVLGYSGAREQEELAELVKMLVRRGHGWNWLAQ